MTIKTICLNTAVNCSYIKIGSKVIVYSFDIPAIEVKSGAKLRVVNFCHSSASSFVSIKLKDVSYNSTYYYCNEGTYPTIIAYNFSNNAPNSYLGCELTLNKQSINFINLQVTDSITDINSGIVDTANFIITLEIEEQESLNV